MPSLRRFLFPLALLPFLAALASAGTPVLQLAGDVSVHGQVLHAGRYRVELSPTRDAVTFSLGRRPVAEFGCEVKPLDGTYATDLLVQRPAAKGPAELERILLARERLDVRLLEPRTVDRGAPVPPRVAAKGRAL